MQPILGLVENRLRVRFEGSFPDLLAAVLCAFDKAMQREVTAPSHPQQKRLREMEKSAPAFKSAPGSGKESSRPAQSTCRARLEQKAHQPNAKADRLARSAH